ncbi:hypothetical protein [Paracoccus sp. AK26]|uniref:hypothetical protein n=1 Tax=Paracoccus sp. AK26 TaxID=2589076 RepID=UPI0014285162|nr:hypothetical protein [Paracoccus sp. AK26]QIR85008.1 hypothetical protein FIU66_07190 [Paracoccus sp. AK26]
MADEQLPELHYRGDIIVMAALDPEAPTDYTNFCGATSIDLSINNAMSETTVAPCNDWTLPPQVVREYGAQSVSATINAQVAKGNRDKILRWARDQRKIPLRFHFVGAEAGEVEYIDGIAMLPTHNITGIGNTDRQPVLQSLSIQFQKGVQFTDKT